MTITFNELTGTYYTPTIAVETDLVSGASGLPSTNKRLLLVGNKLAAGTHSQSDGIPAQIFSAAQARDLFGAGSVLSVMCESALNVSSRIPIFALPLDEPGAGAQAAGTVTLATTATSAGVLSVWIAGQRFQTGIAKDDTATEVGDLIVAEINNAANLPATAANASGVVTITARNKGLEGNTIQIHSEITASAMTATDSGQFLSGGTLATDPATPLATTESDRYHIIAMAGTDSTAVASLKAHIVKQSGATVQRWCRGIIASTDDQSTAQALALTIDDYRVECAWHYKSNQTQYALAAALAAEATRVTDRNQSLNYHVIKGIEAQFVEAAWASAAEIEAAISNGLTCFRSFRNGTTEVVRSVSTRTTNPAYRDNLITEISDYFDEDIIAIIRARYFDSALKFGSPAGTDRTVTPNRMRATIAERIRLMDSIDYVQASEAVISESLKVEGDATDATRMNISVDFVPVQAFNSAIIKKTYKTPEVS